MTDSSNELPLIEFEERIVGPDGGFVAFESQEGDGLKFRLHLNYSYETHIRCIGGGGGGGADSDRQGYGGGGRAGLCTHKPVRLDAGIYLINIGQGGAGAVCTDDAPPNPGGQGGTTYIEFLPSHLRYAQAPGGEGGKTNTPAAEPGESSIDENGQPLAQGGPAADGWRRSGGAGHYPGAGGGGAGNQGGDDRDVHGGNGANGAIRVVILSRC